MQERQLKKGDEMLVSSENDIKIERNQEMVEICEQALKGGE